MNRSQQKFLGQLLFTYDGWDDLEIGYLQFYDVEFPFTSMKRYDANTVTLQIDGTMEIYNDVDEHAVWTGFPTDIEEWEGMKLRKEYSHDGK